METEAFKCLILEQFKNPDSAISDVMLNTESSILQVRGHFKKKNHLISHEYGIIIGVELIQSPAMDNTFQLTFENVADVPHDKYELSRIDRTSGGLQPVTLEEVSIVSDSIRFSISSYNLVTNGYIYKREHVQTLCSLDFNLKMLKFMDKKSFNHNVSEIERCRAMNSKAYMEYHPTNKLRDEIANALASNRVSNNDQREIMDSLNLTAPYIGRSVSLASVIHKLSSPWFK